MVLVYIWTTAWSIGQVRLMRNKLLLLHSPHFIPSKYLADACKSSVKWFSPSHTIWIPGLLNPPLLTHTYATRNAFPPCDRGCSSLPVWDFVYGMPVLKLLPKESINSNSLSQITSRCPGHISRSSSWCATNGDKTFGYRREKSNYIWQCFCLGGVWAQPRSNGSEYISQTTITVISQTRVIARHWKMDGW